MKRTPLIILISLTLLEGVAAIFVLWQMEFDPGRGQIINYSLLRWLLVAMSVLVIGILAAALVALLRGDKLLQVIQTVGERRLMKPSPGLFFVQGALVLMTIFLAECFLLSYLAIPVPARPILAWMTMTSFQIWLFLRLTLAGEYRKRDSLGTQLRRKWKELLPVQRKTLIVLTVLGLLYFIGFMPFNYRLDEEGRFYTHADETVIYPDVTRVLVWQGTFSDMVHLVIEDWPWWYGFPYLPISAAVLVIPRLVQGADYANNIQLNIFLLRQFINILPMIASIFLIIHLVNRFRSMWQSVLMFVFLAGLPGVVMFNYRFWHPDSIIILLILLTFYLLEKDELRFGGYFYLAAVTCGLATAIKLWGVFFVLAIGGTLLAGLVTKRLTFKKAVFSGFGFIAAMTGTILITSPGLLAPYIRNGALEGWATQQNSLLHGYDRPDPSNEYGMGMFNWLRFIGYYYIQPFFAFFGTLSLVLGSLWGKRKTLCRLILAWSVVVAVFLFNFAVMKTLQYMLPLAIPLCLGALLFPTLSEPAPGAPSFLGRILTRKVAWGVTLAMLLIQFAINWNILLTSPLMGFQ